jgi:hypothetical protein
LACQQELPNVVKTLQGILKTGMNINLGKWTRYELDNLIEEASRIMDAGSRIEYLSEKFLGTAYGESTLVGDVDTPEFFVINLEFVDCFTFIDYIEAMRMCRSLAEFEDKLKRVRYRSGKVAFNYRNHFFTDWKEFNSEFVSDVTELVGKNHTKEAQKSLNDKGNGTYYVPGINTRVREIIYIPGENINDSIIKRLMTGDYVGIYSELPGLDVSHVGIVIKRDKSVYLRHASSGKDQRKVIDQDFNSYTREKPGVMVLRPNNIT